MVEVHYVEQQQDHIYLLEILGHADYAEKGQDIVCSAVSILAYSLEGAADTLPEDEVKRVVQFKEGYVTFMFKANENTQQETLQKMKHIMEMALIGYSMLAATYPGHVTVHM